MPENERGAQAGIEPAMGAWMTHQIGSARAVQKLSTHLHQFGATDEIAVPWALLATLAVPSEQAVSVRVTLRVTLNSDHERRRRAFGPDPTRWRPDGTDDDSNSRRRVGHVTISLPDDVKQISWAAEQLGIGTSTAYRLVAAGKIPGAFKVGAQWRISVPRFLAEVHGEPTTSDHP